MKKSTTMTAGATLVAMVLLVSTARPARAIGPNLRAQMYNWHGNYAYTPYGRPTALVVPPTANLQTNWSWGAASSSVTRIDHQFTRDYLGPGAAGGTALDTPLAAQHESVWRLLCARSLVPDPVTESIGAGRGSL